MTYRPMIQHQGPDCRCQIGSECLGWSSCTCYAMAMGIDKATAGQTVALGCAIRKFTDDTDAGTKLSQVAAVSKAHYGVEWTVRVGSKVIEPVSAAHELKRDRPILLQGNTGPLIGTTHQDTNGPVNHCVELNEGAGWDGDTPSQVLVFDPAADGRRDLANGPQWWSWNTVLRFAAALRPAGDDRPGVLGPGHWYAAFGPVTPPWAELHYGAKRTHPFPDRTRADQLVKGHLVNVHSSPTSGNASVVDHLADGELFEAWQVTTKGDSLAGSTRWYGNQNGTRWVHEHWLTHEGGAT